jgi:phosphoglycolate phosphatase-like HAD superfamily hydrolase
MSNDKRRILLFDIDGTLLESTGEDRMYFRRALADVYGVTDPVGPYDMAGKTDWQILTDLMQKAGLNLEEIEARRVEAFATYAQNLELAAATFHMRLLPSVADLMNILKDDSRFILGLVTGNVREAVPHKLRAVGLDPDIFTFGAYGSEHQDRNTLPNLALYRLGQLTGSPVSPDSALVIGDTPLDIACARHAGMKVLSVATGDFDRETLETYHPDYLLDDLADTKAVMQIFMNY